MGKTTKLIKIAVIDLAEKIKPNIYKLAEQADSLRDSLNTAFADYVYIQSQLDELLDMINKEKDKWVDADSSRTV